MPENNQPLKLIKQSQLAIENGDFRCAFKIHKKLTRLFNPESAFDHEKMHMTFRFFMSSVYGIEFARSEDYA